jgi:mono/diheme cytochrome c family protein
MRLLPVRPNDSSRRGHKSIDRRERRERRGFSLRPPRPLRFLLLTPLVWIIPIGPALRAQQSANGKKVYDKWCSGCHGDTGAGDGVASKVMLPHPRDFTKGVYKIRTTASGEIPTDDNIRHIVEVGMPGTAMPEWKSRLTQQEINDVVAYVKTFSNFFATTKANPISIGKAPSSSASTIADGRATFLSQGCIKCHGQQGRGDGTSAPTLKDDYDAPIRAADLNESWKFRGGNTVEEIYTRLRTGLDGTPMPSFSDAIENKKITDEQLWHVAQYVRSLSPAEPPEVREVVRSALVQRLPTAPDDSAWNSVERFWVPLVGQIIAKPRWFAPTVDGIWVQSLHDGRRVTVKLTWDDPSKSPNPAWNEWLGRISQTLSDVDGTIAKDQSFDRLVVQFPKTITDDAERPYFLGGNARKPAYAWAWTSEPDEVREGTLAGLGHFSALGSTQVTHAARYVDGQWQLVLSRALAPSDTTKAPRFTAGQAIPIAFFAADGSNGEDDVRGSVSTWYAIYLDVPTPTRVFAMPIATVLLTAGFGFLLITRAQRRERWLDQSHSEEK